MADPTLYQSFHSFDRVEIRHTWVKLGTKKNAISYPLRKKNIARVTVQNVSTFNNKKVSDHTARINIGISHAVNI